MAEKVWLLRPLNHPIVKVYGYSWGGANAIRLARELAKRSIPVRTMVLSDAVYRHRYRLGAWRAFLPWKQLEVPPNVHEVHWYRQESNLPRGHEVVAADPRRTQIRKPATLDAIHQYMDDAPEFQAKAMEVAREP